MNENKIVESKMTEIAKLLNVELGETFKIKFDNGNISKNFYYLTERGLFDESGERMSDTLVRLLIGDFIIKKYPWKPKEGELVYIVEFDYFSESFKPKKYKYCNSLYFQMLYRLGLIFKTEKEAEENIHLTMQLMGCDDFIEWGNKNEKRLED